MALPNGKEMPDDNVKSIAELAAAARGFSTHTIKAPAVGAEGVPDELMIGFDHRKTGPDAVVDLTPLLEKYRWRPERKTGNANVTTLESFIALTNRHKTEHSVIFAKTDLPDPSFSAIIDYHLIGEKTPDFLRHRIIYDFPLSDEFETWQNNNANVMQQGEFAEFIEENIAHISTPTETEILQLGGMFRTTIANPVDMIELSRGLEVTVNAGFKGATKLQSGEGQISYSEEHQTSITVPGLFIVAIPVFFAGAVVRLPARLRYRAHGGRINWFYQLYRHEDVVRERVLADLYRAQEGTALPFYEGSPEA